MKHYTSANARAGISRFGVAADAARNRLQGPLRVQAINSTALIRRRAIRGRYSFYF